MDDRVRLERRRVWIIDPVDGTREYGEPQRDNWAVHVALAIDGRPAVGAVALPTDNLTAHTGQPPELAPPTAGPIRLAVSRTRPPACAEQLGARLDATLVPMGFGSNESMAPAQPAP